MKIYIVGGAVRDKLLGLECNDKDYVVVGSSKEEMINLGFDQVGDFFPVFLHPETREEFALARTERKSGVGHTAFDVDASSEVTLTEDLARRDLTINAIATDTDGTIIDPFNGVGDLNEKILRHVSSAFTEDPLRVVRLARFASRFPDFVIADETRKLAVDMVKSGELNNLSDERFWAELLKTFNNSTDDFIFFKTLFEFGCFTHVKFFNSIWGNIDNFTLSSLFKRVLDNSKWIGSKPRLSLFTALTTIAPKSDRFAKVDSDMSKLAECVDDYKRLSGTSAEEIYTLAKRVGAYSNVSSFNLAPSFYLMFTTAIGVLNISGKMNKINQQIFADILNLPIVNQETFPDIVGKALGESIKVKRIADIQTLLDLEKS